MILSTNYVWIDFYKSMQPRYKKPIKFNKHIITGYISGYIL